MQLILTKLNPIYIEDFPNGKIDLQELKIWPGWNYAKFDTILTYKIGNDNYALKVIMNKKYTFDILAQAISDLLNVNNEQVINLYHNNGRVTWRVFPPPKPTNPKLSAGMMAFLRPHNIKLSEDIIKLFKLENVQPDKNGIMTGAPVDKSSISFCFSNASTVFLTCDECDKTTIVNNQKTNAIVAMPVATAMDGSITASLPASLTFTDNYSNRLNFHIQDELGNDLVVQKVFLSVIINERLCRENIP